MARQEGKAEAFRALHEGEPFVIPNPWDAGSARMLEALGFQALATTSSGFAFTLGKRDGNVTLDELVAHVAALDAATGLPVSVDLENGFEPSAEGAAAALGRMAAAGAVGGSLEDWDPAEERIYDFEHAVERVAAAAAVARELDFPFTFTARAENHIHGRDDLGVPKLSAQYPFPLIAATASAYHAARESQLVKQNYGMNMTYLDIQTYASPSKGADGDHIAVIGRIADLRSVLVTRRRHHHAILGGGVPDSVCQHLSRPLAA